MVALAKLDGNDAHLYFMTGMKSKQVIIDLNAACENANVRFDKSDHKKDVLQNALLGFHIFTGCGSTSTFSGCGKFKLLQLLSFYSK